MKYAVGYQLRSNRSFVEQLVGNKEKIHEVYFSWADFPNGRNSQIQKNGMTPWEAQRNQEEELLWLAKQGIHFNLLFNAMCYGRESQSRAFFKKIGETVEYVAERLGLESITTTSPLIAKFLKQNFPNLEIRASINMGIGTIQGMDYLADYYDSYYIQREYNRDFIKIKELKSWCDGAGKKLYALANGGCLNYCSAHVFHDNLVSHETEIAKMDNGYAFSGICAEYLQREANALALLENTSFIRPEDIYRYEPYFSVMKLATRIHGQPARVIRAYMEGSGYGGNILDLLEPNHAALFYPWVLENKLISCAVRDGKLVYGDFENAFKKIEEPVMLEEKYANE